MSEFERINRLPTYVFQEVNDLKAKLRHKGKDIIDFGMGNPDMPTPSHIRENFKKQSTNLVQEDILQVEEYQD